MVFASGSRLSFLFFRLFSSVLFLFPLVFSSVVVAAAAATAAVSAAAAVLLHFILSYFMHFNHCVCNVFLSPSFLSSLKDFSIRCQQPVLHFLVSFNFAPYFDAVFESKLCIMLCFLCRMRRKIIGPNSTDVTYFPKIRRYTSSKGFVSKCR
jgi:hypothetical protein